MNISRTMISGPRQGSINFSIIADWSPNPAMPGRIGANPMPAASTFSRYSSNVAISGRWPRRASSPATAI
ncbi:hypothetical protein D3C83_04640 [compost metagenome]